MNIRHGIIKTTVKRSGLISVVLSMLILPACATQVTKSPEVSKPEIRALQNVTMKMPPQAVQKIANDVEFDIETFKDVLMGALKSRRLLATDGDFDLNVVINEVRIRGTGSAVWLGFLAGDDHVTGDIIVLNRNGESVYTYNVNASYALGGFAGGGDSTRVNWLYKKFSEIVSDELVTKRGEKE